MVATRPTSTRSSFLDDPDVIRSHDNFLNRITASETSNDDSLNRSWWGSSGIDGYLVPAYTAHLRTRIMHSAVSPRAQATTTTRTARAEKASATCSGIASVPSGHPPLRPPAPSVLRGEAGEGIRRWGVRQCEGSRRSPSPRGNWTGAGGGCWVAERAP